MGDIKHYRGIIPACGVFCGGCPIYTRDKKPCPGAEANIARCENCKSFHQCCQTRGISHCHKCTAFPCRRFRDFRDSWLKYGQDLIANQRLLSESGPKDLLKYYNDKTTKP